MKTLLLLLLTSCSHGYHSYKDNAWHPDVEDVGKLIVCPTGTHYNPRTELCQYTTIIAPKPIETKGKPRKPLKSPINCVKTLSYCGVKL